MSKNYCKECGTPLKRKRVGAENYAQFPEYSFYTPYPKYNPKTGKRNFARKYYCPNGSWWEAFKGRHHTSFGKVDEEKYYH